MSSIHKSLAIALIGVVAISCMSVLTVKSETAQVTRRPSVQEFTAKVVDNNLEVTIKNQPLTPYENGSYPSLYYMFRFKDNNTMIGQWNYDPMYFVLPATYDEYHEASDSDFTTVSLSLDNYQYPSGQIDLQVIALIGIQYPTFEPASKGNEHNGTVYVFEGEISDWTPHQYIAIPASSSLPTVPENSFTAPAMVIITPLSVTYQNSSVPLFFGANVLTGSPEITSLSYSLDGNQNITITALGKTGLQHFDSQTGYTYHTNSTLTIDNLANGNHTLWVYSHDAVGTEMSGLVQFTVDDSSSTPSESAFNFWFLIPVLIVVAIVLVVILLLYKRQRETA